MDTLAACLAKLDRLQKSEVSLDDLRSLITQLNLWPTYPLLMVTGTNGKGSVCHALEHLFSTHHYRTGLFTSPHLRVYNERIRVNLLPASDPEILAALQFVLQAKSTLNLSYFHCSFFAALSLFQQAKVEVGIFEIGIGGRHDAVNILDPAVSVITYIGLDHTEILGKTKEAIGWQKAGVLRKGRVAIVADPALPLSVVQEAKQVGALLQHAGIDFTWKDQGDHWDFADQTHSFQKLPKPKIALVNAASALKAFLSFPNVRPQANAIAKSFQELSLIGRQQWLPGFVCPVMVDASKNPESIAFLAETLKSESPEKVTQRHLVFSCLSNKPALEMIQAMTLPSLWHVAELKDPRAASLHSLVEALSDKNFIAYPTIEAAFAGALSQATPSDQIIVCGSFLTVSAILEWIDVSQKN